MAEQQLINAFDDCVNHLAAGEHLEACLQRYPEYADRLRPLLETSRQVEQAGVDAFEMNQVRERMRLRVAAAVRVNRLHKSSPQVFAYRLRLIAASLLVFFLCGMGSAMLAAQNSLPGEPLYPFKRFAEGMRLALPGSNQALEDQFARRRVDEVVRLLAQGRSADVAFRGTVEARTALDWRVAGLTVQVPDDTLGIDGLQIGDRVEVKAYTTARRELIAVSIRLLEDNVDLMSTATPQPTPITTGAPPAIGTPTSAVTRTRTATPSPTATATLTATLSITHTPSPTATATPPATATATATQTPTPTASASASTTPARTSSPTHTRTPSPSPTATTLVACLTTPDGDFDVRVRSGGAIGYPVIGELLRGQFYPVVAYNNANGRWYAVRFMPDRVGWVSSTFTRLSGPCDNLPVMSYPPLPTPTPVSGGDGDNNNANTNVNDNDNDDNGNDNHDNDND